MERDYTQHIKYTKFSIQWFFLNAIISFYRVPVHAPLPYFLIKRLRFNSIEINNDDEQDIIGW